MNRPLPDWALMNLFKSEGTRLPKRKLFDSHSHWMERYGAFLGDDEEEEHSVERKVVTGIPERCAIKHCQMKFQVGLKAMFRNNQWICENCYHRNPLPLPSGFFSGAPVVGKTSTQFRADEFRAEMVRRSKQSYRGISRIPRGCLPEMDYRFWIGSYTEGMTSATCRVCRKVVENARERDLHNHEKGIEWSCYSTMVEALKLLQARRMCLVCNTDTELSRWGVPLCSPNCVLAWKFERGRQYLQLALACRKVKAMRKQREEWSLSPGQKNGGSKLMESTLEPTPKPPEL